MSSFKRKPTSKSTSTAPQGARVILGGTVPTYITSTGIPSLDDILGGGIPLTTTLTVLAPDLHSAYGELVQKYFIAQGIASGQKVVVVDDEARGFVGECMWMPGSSSLSSSQNQSQPSPGVKDDEEEEDASSKEHDTKIKIAWRYEQMKQFQTTVSSASSQSNDEYCRIFDLTSKIPGSTIDSACSSGQLRFLHVQAYESELLPTRRLLAELKQILSDHKNEGSSSARILRICIPSLGSAQWGDLRPEELCYFLHSLRSLVRAYPTVCASISLPPHLSSDTNNSPGWVQKLGWLSDGCISLSAFGANPSLTALFPTHHGFVHIHTLPAPHTLLPPSDKYSTLRGISSSASGENNLAFKCMRKRLIFETMHLDLEGGVGERRTTPAPTTVAMVEAEAEGHHHHRHDQVAVGVGGAIAKVEVQIEAAGESPSAKVVSQEQPVPAPESAPTSNPPSAMKKNKPKKKVAFHSDRPDLYDF
ncbi:PAXNEB-domain-containing protein [Panus rudis PR-1116 ss-1]|nr:PAXNEB-domain-containing protein [Panus rudis PR-1116 ss-1]